MYNNAISFREEDKYMVPQFTNETVKIENLVFISREKYMDDPNMFFIYRQLNHKKIDVEKGQLRIF